MSDGSSIQVWDPSLPTGGLCRAMRQIQLAGRRGLGLVLLGVVIVAGFQERRWLVAGADAGGVCRDQFPCSYLPRYSAMPS
jgi:hypothetical protein